MNVHDACVSGVESLLDDEAQRIGGRDNVHATRDLYTSIAAGDFPEWVYHVQLVDPSRVATLDFDPLDVAKAWPEDLFPLVEIGRMVLNKNIDNFFNENEQLAFSPKLVMPGNEYSNDKLLQARMFSYTDTQRYRIGPNYLNLPVDEAKSGTMNNQQVDSFTDFVNKSNEEIKYFHSKFSGARLSGEYPISSEGICGKSTQEAIPEENNFGSPATCTAAGLPVDRSGSGRGLPKTSSFSQGPPKVSKGSIGADGRWACQ
eukprot:evm.model.scf_1282.3 EVM.evm.TU.scf_1282.3   scf_1282:20411-22170(+)